MTNYQWKKGKGAPLSFDEWMSGFLDRSTEEVSESESMLADLRADEVSARVRSALAALEEPERIALEGYDLMGRAPSEVAADMSLSLRAFERLLRSARQKMRNQLAEFVAERFGYTETPRSDCPICESPKRARAERMIAEKAPCETWKRVMRKLRDCCGITIETPQTLIGHQKYHRFKSQHSIHSDQSH